MPAPPSAPPPPLPPPYAANSGPWVTRGIFRRPAC
jgi:hypothetical protein